jgi:hypothetical protein
MTASPFSVKRLGSSWIRWLILTLLLGTATVVLIARTDKQEVEIAIAATFENLAGDLLLTEGPRQTIRMLISGTSSALKSIDPAATACRMDLTGLSEGRHIIAVHPADVDLPKGVALQRLLTPSITIRLETVSLKTVDVVAVLEGNPAPGFAVAAVTLKPDHIVLRGTAPMLEGIDTVKTRPINLAAAAESFKKDVPLNLPEAIVRGPATSYCFGPCRGKGTHHHPGAGRHTCLRQRRHLRTIRFSPPSIYADRPWPGGHCQRHRNRSGLRRHRQI